MLTFNLKKQWFDKIKNGEKTHEYREVTDYWTKRIFKELFGDEIAFNYTDFVKALKKEKYEFICGIIFTKGYPKADEDDKFIFAKAKSFSIVNGKTTDLAIDKPVYDIEFEVIKCK